MLIGYRGLRVAVQNLMSLPDDVRRYLVQCRRASTNGTTSRHLRETLDELLNRLEDASGALDLHDLLSMWMLLVQELGAQAAAKQSPSLHEAMQDWSAEAAVRLAHAFSDRSLRASPATQLEVLTVLAQHLMMDGGAPITAEKLLQAADRVASALEVGPANRNVATVTAQQFSGRTEALATALAESGTSRMLGRRRGSGIPGGSGDCKLIALFFATFRREDRRYSNSYLKYGSKWNSDLTFGTAEVSIPLSRLTYSLRRDYAREPELKKHGKIDRSEFFVLEDARTVTRRDFLDALNGKISKKTLLVFIHGFRQTHADALIHAAQIFEDLTLEGAPLVLSWPSGFIFGSPSYEEAIAEYNRRNAASAFADVISQAARDCDAEEILLVGHSLGCRVLCDVTRHLDLASSRFTNLVLASPDIDLTVFHDGLKFAMNISNKAFVYASKSDRALQWASRLDVPRAGANPARLVKFGYPKLEIVATEGCFYDSPDFWRHSDFSCGAGPDLRDALKDHSPTRRRLEERKVGQGSYWAIS